MADDNKKDEQDPQQGAKNAASFSPIVPLEATSGSNDEEQGTQEDS